MSLGNTEIDWLTPDPDKPDIETTPGSPLASAQYRGQLYLVYREDSDALYWLTFDDQSGWSGIANPVNNTKTEGDFALAAFGGDLYLAFQTSTETNIYLTTVSGTSQPVPLRFQTGGQIALQAIDDVLYLVYQERGSGSLYLASWRNGGAWSDGADTGANAATDNGAVDLTCLGGQLVMAYTDPEGKLKTAIYDAGSGDWDFHDTDHQAQAAIGITNYKQYSTEDDPTAESLVLVYKRQGSDELHVITSADRNDWSSTGRPIPGPGGSDSTVSLGAICFTDFFGSQLLLNFQSSSSGLVGFRAGAADETDVQKKKRAQWFSMFSGNTGTSGIARVNAAPPMSSAIGDDPVIARFLAVFDNKGSGPYVSLLGWSDGFLPVIYEADLAWDGSAPSDLEALTGIPGSDPELFLASSSSGHAYVLSLDFSGTTYTARVEQTIHLTLPQVGGTPSTHHSRQIEAVCAQILPDEGDGPSGDQLVIAWATRYPDDSGSVPISFSTATVEGNRLNIENTSPDSVYMDPFSWSGPAGVRPVSDFKIDSSGDGLLYAVAAYDPDVDDGPFASQVYIGGQFVLADGVVSYEPDNPDFQSPMFDLKVEAIELTDQGFYDLATDDENLGSAFYTNAPYQDV